MPENRKRKPTPSSWITSYFAKEQRKVTKVIRSVPIFRADFAFAGGSEWINQLYKIEMKKMLKYTL